MSRRRRELYCGHARLCVCLSVCLSVCVSVRGRICSHYCTDPDVTWGSGRECPLVVHYWADLQSVHWLRCYGNITRTRNVSEYTLVLALCLINVCTYTAPIVICYYKTVNMSSAVAEMGDRAEKWGLLCSFPWGELGPHLTQCRLGRGLPPYRVVS